MTTPNAGANGRTMWRNRVGLAMALIVAACAYAYWRASHNQPGNAPATQAVAPSAPAKPRTYSMSSNASPVRTDFPAGAIAMSSAEIVAALSNHTALLPGGFVKYYAPDGSLHGLAEGKRYAGGWQVRDGAFCTLLQDSDTTLCSPVAQAGGTLYWSVDGDRQASAVITVPGNPRNLP